MTAIDLSILFINNLIFHWLCSFWKRLGQQISKICPGESKLHIVCKNVAEGRQGKEVICITIGGSKIYEEKSRWLKEIAPVITRFFYMIVSFKLYERKGSPGIFGSAIITLRKLISWQYRIQDFVLNTYISVHTSNEMNHRFPVHCAN